MKQRYRVPGIEQIKSADFGIDSMSLRRCRFCGLPMSTAEKLKAHRRCLVIRRRQVARKRQSTAAKKVWRQRKKR